MQIYLRLMQVKYFFFLEFINGWAKASRDRKAIYSIEANSLGFLFLAINFFLWIFQFLHLNNVFFVTYHWREEISWRLKVCHVLPFHFWHSIFERWHLFEILNKGTPLSISNNFCYQSVNLLSQPSDLWQINSPKDFCNDL